MNSMKSRQQCLIALYIFLFASICLAGPSQTRGGLIWVEDTSGCRPDILDIDVLISTPDQPLDSFMFIFHYPVDLLDFTSCSPGELDPGWAVLDCDETSPGTIEVTGSADPGFIPEGSIGSLLVFQFSAICVNCPNGMQGIVEFTDLSEDMTGWGIQNGRFIVDCPVTPTPIPPPANQLSVGSFTGCGEDTFEIPITLTNDANEVDVFGLYFEYCPEIMTYESCRAGDLDPGWLVFGCNEPELGQVRISAFSYPGIIPVGSSGVLAYMSFSMTCSPCQSGMSCPLVISKTVNDLENVNITHGLATCNCVESTPTPVPVHPDTISLEPIEGCSGDTIVLDVRIDNTTMPLSDFDFYVNYCPDVFLYMDCRSGNLDNEWGIFACDNPLPGQIHITGSNSTVPIPMNSDGSIASITFTVQCTDCADENNSEISLNHLMTGVTGWTIENTLFTYVCPTALPTFTPTFAPTDTPTSEPSETPIPTDTPVPTFTPIPTSTPTPIWTSLPTATPVSVYLNGHVDLERMGVTPPDPSWSIDITVSLCSGGSLVTTYPATTDQNGNFSLEAMPGVFDIMIKNSHTLQVRQDNIVIPESGGTDIILFGVLPEGDADDDNLVLSSDFFILRDTYNKAEGDAGYDDRADFNEDNIVTSPDFFLLRNHYNVSGVDCGL